MIGEVVGGRKKEEVRHASSRNMNGRRRQAAKEKAGVGIGRQQQAA